MTGSMDILCVALFGEAEVESRERLFSNKSTVEVKDDTGKLVSSHPDWDEHTYAEIIRVFSQEDDYIYLPRIVSGEDSKTFRFIVGIQKFIVVWFTPNYPVLSVLCQTTWGSEIS